MIDIGTDFSGVGAFEQALIRLDIAHKTIFACDIDKYARQTYVDNYGTPDYFPEDVYDRLIPTKSLDIYMTSPPCQSFSLAGKRKGEDDKRGTLFYNSHEFIKENKPRYFIFENVKGLLSDHNGKTFRRWLDFLGGKSVNGNPVIFPHEESVPYHIYHKVLNAKHYGVPQNRERVFIIGIRDDADNTFTFPKKQHLTKRLKDVLEDNVDEKYYLSDRMIKYFTDNQKGKGNGRATDFLTGEELNSHCLLSTYYKQPKDGIYLKVKSATKNGFETATISDSINFSQPNSQTRRGRVGKEVAQTLETSCNQGVIINPLKDKTDEGWHFEQGVYDENGITRALKSSEESGNKPKVIVDNWIIGGLQKNQPKQFNGVSPCLNSAMGMGGGQTPIHNYDYKIRRLTVRECFRLMDFPDTFHWSVSDTQAYKQAGNSIVVSVLCEILKKLNVINK